MYKYYMMVINTKKCIDNDEEYDSETVALIEYPVSWHIDMRIEINSSLD